MLAEHASHGDTGHVHHLVQLNASEAAAYLERYSHERVLYSAYPIRLHMDNDTTRDRWGGGGPRRQGCACTWAMTPPGEGTWDQGMGRGSGHG